MIPLHPYCADSSCCFLYLDLQFGLSDGTLPRRDKHQTVHRTTHGPTEKREYAQNKTLREASFALVKSETRVERYLAVSCRRAFRKVSGWKSSARSRVSDRRAWRSARSTQLWMGKRTDNSEQKTQVNTLKWCITQACVPNRSRWCFSQINST